MTRRAINVKDIDGNIISTIEISKAVAIKSGNIEMICIDKAKDGNFRLTYSECMVPDWSRVAALEMIRDD